MGNFACTLILIIGLTALADSICKSLDCIGGNKAACEIVAKRYEAR